MSYQENAEIKRMDDMIGYLMDSLMRIGMHECINVIVVADHGMANRTCEQVYVLDDVSSGIRFGRTLTCVLASGKTLSRDFWAIFSECSQKL